jgi:hypothetical protein
MWQMPGHWFIFNSVKDNPSWEGESAQLVKKLPTFMEHKL